MSEKIAISDAVALGYTDVSDELERKNRKSGIGWDSEELWHQGAYVACWGYAGVSITDKNYVYCEETEGDKVRIKIFQKERVEPQVPLVA